MGDKHKKIVLKNSYRDEFDNLLKALQGAQATIVSSNKALLTIEITYGKHVRDYVVPILDENAKKFEK